MKAKPSENGSPVKTLIASRLQAPNDQAGVAKWPVLTELLFPVWKDGKCVRQSGDMKIRLVGGYYLLTLHCPTEQLETTLTAETLVDALDALETLLASGKAVWMPDWNATKKTRQVTID
jgi:hypothetical protein